MYSRQLLLTDRFFRHPAKLAELKSRYFHPGKGAEGEIMREYKLSAAPRKRLVGNHVHPRYIPDPPSLQTAKQTPNKTVGQSFIPLSTSATPSRNKLAPIHVSPQRKSGITPHKQLSRDQNTRLNLNLLANANDAIGVAEQTSADNNLQDMRFAGAGTADVAVPQPDVSTADVEMFNSSDSSGSAASPNIFDQLAFKSSSQRALARPALRIDSATVIKKRNAQDEAHEGAAYLLTRGIEDQSMAEAPARCDRDRDTAPERTRTKRFKASMPHYIRGADDDPPTEADSDGNDMDEDA